MRYSTKIIDPTYGRTRSASDDFSQNEFKREKTISMKSDTARYPFKKPKSIPENIPSHQVPTVAAAVHTSAWVNAFPRPLSEIMFINGPNIQPNQAENTASKTRFTG